MCINFINYFAIFAAQYCAVCMKKKKYIQGKIYFRSIRSLCHETDLLASEIIDQTKSVLAGDADQMDELNKHCLNWKTKVKQIFMLKKKTNQTYWIWNVYNNLCLFVFFQNYLLCNKSYMLNVNSIMPFIMAV